MIPPTLNPIIHEYDPEGFYDELFSGPGAIRPEFSTFYDKLSELSREELFRRQQSADRALREMNATPIGMYSNDAERRSGQLLSELSYLTVDEIVRKGLHECLDDLQIRMNQLHVSISERYFNPDAHDRAGS